ncbi:MAG: hypothetical protein HY841_10725 [Bacteroidetes bacterium]|nr:hypothetical protein [Bacteroidota bacterium]
MSEENKPEPSEEESRIEKRYKEELEKEKQKEKEEAKMKLEIEADLRTNPRYKPFFEKFNSRSVEDFIGDYPADKIRWLEHGSWMFERDEKHKLHYYTKAEHCFFEIQQKKLFDLQCKWRAEQIKLDGVEICYDFDYWEHHIHNCPFLPAVTMEEVEIYIQYLHSNNVEMDEWFGGFLDTQWQDYENIKEEYQQDEDTFYMPEWYDFHNSRTGMGILLTLPNIRGEKEDFYLNLHHKPGMEKSKEREAAKSEDEKKPSLRSHGETLEEFISQFEARHVRNCYNAYHHKGRKYIDDDDELKEAIETLLNAEKEITISFGMDWREAILETAKRYDADVIAELLPRAHEEYLQKTELGFITEDMEAEPHPSKDSTRGIWMENILHGRELNAEPRNLNF